MIATIEETWLGAKVFRLSGRHLRLLTTLHPVTVLIGRGMKYFERMENVEAGAWHRQRPAEADFDSIKITTSGLETCKFIVTDGESGYDRFVLDQRLINAWDLVQEPALALASPGLTTVLAALQTRKRAVFMADPTNVDGIWLGSSDHTYLNSPIELQPGDMWIETMAPHLEWRSYVGNVGSHKIRVQTWT